MSRPDRSRADLLALFRDPPAEYGDFATWFWETGTLTRERITWQLEQMKAAGVSGTWYYPRFVGTEPMATDPPYWSGGWRELFNHSVAEHRRLGMKAGFSDWTGRGYWQERLREEGRTRPELVGRRLVCHEAAVSGGGPVLEMAVPGPESVVSAAAYRVAAGAGDRLDGDSRIDLSDRLTGGTLTWSAPGGTWRVMVVTTERHDLDYLNPAVAARWLELYSEVHERELGELFGETLDVFLHDELWVLRGNIIFSQALADRIRADHGYDPLPEIAALFRDIGPRTDKVRCDYYEAVAVLLEEHFYRPFSRWHEERGLRFATIATWGRQSVLGQTWHYVDYFRYLRHFHITGNEDPLGAEPGNRCLIDAKMSSSIEHIYRRERSAVCAYWRSGWGMTQDQNLAWTHENFAYGLNLYNGHGGLYGSMGGWYEWEPPLIYSRQPYARHWPAFVRHVSRLGAVMSQGTHCADVALLYPLTTVHAHWLRGEHFTSLAYEAGNECFALAQHLYRNGIDFDFVDDHSLNGAEIGDGVLAIAGIEFRCVVVPPMTTIKTSTLETLKRFYDAGGTVIGYRRLPTASQERGRGDPRVRELVQAIFQVAPDRAYAHAAGKRAMDQLPLYSQALDSVHVNGNERGGSAIYLPVMQMHGTPYNEGPRVAAMIERSVDLDVRCSAADVYHTHRRTLAAGRRTDVYFLFNQSNERRDVEVTFRCVGEPALWDAATGSTRPLLRWRPARSGTAVRLDMERYAGIIVVFDTAEDAAGSPPGTALRVVDDNLDELIRLDGSGGDVAVEALADSGGRKHVAVADGAGPAGFRGARDVEAPPAPLTIGGAWRLSLIPTLDNRWGDFRLPATEGLIGPEARRFRYREEQGTAGTDLGWHTAGHDDSHWQDYLYSEGPFAYSLGPFRPGSEPAEVDNGVVRLDADHVVDGRTCRWQPVAFSPRYGHRHSTPGDPDRRSFEGVPEEYIVFPPSVDDGKAAGGHVRYLLAPVVAPAAGEWDLLIGGVDGAAVGVRLGGAAVAGLSTAAGERRRATVNLAAGPNELLLKLAHVGERPIRMYAAFLNPGEAVPATAGHPLPSLPWFQPGGELVWDVHAAQHPPVGWLRFAAPPGTREMHLPVQAAGAQVWVDGAEVAIDAGRVTLAEPTTVVAQVAVRLDQHPGHYAGAAMPEPVAFTCEPTPVELADWSELALGNYSGGAQYRISFRLEQHHLDAEIELDLGLVHTTAEITLNSERIGVALRAPYRLPVTEQARVGDNDLTIEVYNTLANHFSVGFPPSSHAPREQQGGGLVGPVTVRFRRPVSIIARPVVEL